MRGFEPEQHEMLLQGTQPSGAKEWLCPKCGRRVVMQPPPDHQKVVIAPGNEAAIHVGGKDDPPSAETPAPAPATPATLGEDRAWRDWLDSIGIEWDGPAA